MDELKTTREMDAETLRELVREAASNCENGISEIIVPELSEVRMVGRGYFYHVSPEVFYQVEGISEFNFPDQQIMLSPKQLLVVPPGLPHMERMVPIENRFLTLVTTPWPKKSTVHLSAEEMAGHPTISYAEEFLHSKGSPLLELSGLITGTKSLPAEQMIKASRGLATAFFCHLNHFLSLPRQSSETVSSRVEQALLLIQSRFQDPDLNVQRLAKRIGYSPDYLSHLFRKETGQTITECITDQRLRQAEHMLSYTTYTVSEIADLCGFNSLAYFSRIFTRDHGASPRKYREEQLEAHGIAKAPVWSRK